MVVAACQSFQFFRQIAWFLRNIRTLSKFVYWILHNLISITELFKSHSIEANFNLTTHATLIVCDDIIADMVSNKKFNELVTDL